MRFEFILLFFVACFNVISAEAILSGNDVLPKDPGLSVFPKGARIVQTNATSKWTVVTDSEMIKTALDGKPDMTDGVALHANGDANSVFTPRECVAEILFNLKKQYPLTKIEVFYRKHTKHNNFVISRIKVFTSNDGKNFEYVGSELGKNATHIRSSSKYQLWKIELKLKKIKSQYVKIRAEKDANDGRQIVLSEMVIYGDV